MEEQNSVRIKGVRHYCQVGGQVSSPHYILKNNTIYSKINAQFSAQYPICMQWTLVFFST